MYTKLKLKSTKLVSIAALMLASSGFAMAQQTQTADQSSRLTMYNLETQLKMGNKISSNQVIFATRNGYIGVTYISFGIRKPLSFLKNIAKGLSKTTTSCDVIKRFKSIEPKITVVSINYTTYPYKTLVSNIYDVNDCKHVLKTKIFNDGIEDNGI